MAKPRWRLDVSQQILCGRELLLFLLAGLLRLLRFLRFLSHIALRDPNVGSMQVDFDEHKYKYTTIEKLISRASKKVNGGHVVAHCGQPNSLLRRR